MIESIITIIILVIGSGAILFYLLKIKPIKVKQVKDLYAEGLDLMINGKRKAAYQNFKDIINKDSENIKAYLRLGQVLREGGNSSQAIKVHKGLLYRRNLTHYDKVEMHKNLALDYYKIGNHALAILELHKLLKLEKNNEWAVSQLSTFYRSQKDWANAGKYLAKYQMLVKKENKQKLALYKIQEGRMQIKDKQFSDARKLFEKALSISPNLAVAYYFIGNSYSSESESEYQKMTEQESTIKSDDNSNLHMERAKKLLAKAIPMWIRYAELKPKQAWLVIHLLKDGLFALNRYSEFEDILKQILKSDSDNIEVIASLSEIYSHRGDNAEAIELIDTALEKDSTSLIVKLIKMKLEIKKEKNSIDYCRGLDDIIHFLVTDERFQIYKNTATDADIIWLYESADKKDVLKI